MARELKVNVSFKKQPGDEVIYYKVDGGRFDEEKTIKLNSNSKYKIQLTFRPAVLIDTLNIHGSKIEPEIEKNEDGQSVYSLVWVTTAMDVDKKGKRHKLPVVIESKDGLTLKLNYQVKVYQESEASHSHWGTALSYVDYDCKIPEGSSFVDVVKETYR